MKIEHEEPISFEAKHESNFKLDSLKDFKQSEIGSSTGNNGLYGVGAYVSTRNFKDEGYGKYKNRVNVKLNKPFVISNKSVSGLVNKLNLKNTEPEIHNVVRRHLAFGYPENAFQVIMRGTDVRKGNERNLIMTKKLQEMGYDGVIHHKHGEIEEASIFDNSPCKK